MQVLWDRGPSVVAEVRASLEDELAYTTVLTILRTLETKGYVGHEEEGRGHRYFAKVKQQAAQESALRHMTSKLFKGSAELLLTRLVSDKKLSAEELRRMRKLLGDHAGEGEP
jgi:predicted transcriptional regulator